MTKTFCNHSKLTLILAFSLVFTSLSFAQDLRFGLQASPSWSWMRTDKAKVYGTNTALGLKLGLVVENRFSEAYSISSGIGFHFNTGGSLRYKDSSQIWTNSWEEFEIKPKPSDKSDKEAKSRYSISYVEIPVGLKFRTPETGNHVRWFAEPQIAFGFRSGAKGAISAANPIIEQEKINIKGEVSVAAMSWGIGAGAEYIIQNNTAVVVGLYYQHGFTDVTADGSSKYFDAAATTAAIPDNSKATIRSVTLRFGVMF